MRATVFSMTGTLAEAATLRNHESA